MSQAVAARPRLPRRLFAWLAVVAAVAIVVGSVIPQIVLSLMQLVPVNQTSETTSVASDVTWNGERAGQATLTQSVTTARGETRDDALADATAQLRVDDRTVATLEHSMTLDRGATLPVPGTPARTSLDVDGREVTWEHEAISGIHYFFPFNTERRSYAYVDVAAQEAFPIDYVDELKSGPMTAYVFSQSIPDVELPGEIAEALGVDGGTYAADREIVVEASTGLILDQSEHARVTSGGETVADLDLRWDEETKAHAYDEARGKVLELRVLQIVSWITNAVLVAVVAVAVWAIFRYRSALARREES